MDEYTLVIWKDNYADEFSVESFAVEKGSLQEVKAEHAAKWEEMMEDGFYEHYFGTNEAIEYESLEELARAFSFIPITERQAEFLLATFGRNRAMPMPHL